MGGSRHDVGFPARRSKEFPGKFVSGQLVGNEVNVEVQRRGRRLGEGGVTNACSENVSVKDFEQVVSRSHASSNVTTANTTLITSPFARGVQRQDGRSCSDVPAQPARFPFPQLHCVSAMADNSQQPKGQDGLLSSLNVAIDGLNLAKEISSVTPAKAVFGSVAILLAMIRVCSLLFYDEVCEVHTLAGHNGQRARLRRARAVLCRYLYSPGPRNEWKEDGRPQQVCV